MNNKNDKFKNTDVIDERIRLSKLLNFSEVDIGECFRTTPELTNITFPTLNFGSVPIGNPQFAIRPNNCDDLTLQ